MKRFLDANIVIRYLCDTPADQAARARALINEGSELWVTETVLLEAAYALEKQYHIPRTAIIDAFLALLREPHISISGLEKTTVTQALLLCQPSRRVSIGDALIWAAAYDAGGEVYTFDRRFPSAGIQLREP